MCFYTFLGPETSQETLKKPKNRKCAKNAAKNPCKNLPNKIPNNACCGKKCLKPAISFSIKIGPHFSIYFCTFFLTCFTHFFYHFFEKGWNSFWNPVWDQSGPRGPRWAHKNHQELQRTKKTFIYKNLKKPIGVWRFLAVEASQERLKRPKMAPKRHPQNPRPQKIGIQNRTQKL